MLMTHLKRMNQVQAIVGSAGYLVNTKRACAAMLMNHLKISELASCLNTQGIEDVT
jgi:hypothetical protein